jgi:hypothetical protein
MKLVGTVLQFIQLEVDIDIELKELLRSATKLPAGVGGVSTVTELET